MSPPDRVRPIFTHMRSLVIASASRRVIRGFSRISLSIARPWRISACRRFLRAFCLFLHRLQTLSSLSFLMKRDACLMSPHLAHVTIQLAYAYSASDASFRSDLISSSAICDRGGRCCFGMNRTPP